MIKRTKTTKTQRGHKRGFALIASLTLMMLLGLIAVGVLSMASTQNRLASYASYQMEARQQALIGLDAALAEMQMELGPDQRVTASSGILSESSETPQHVLGVWDSWQNALYSHKEQGISTTYGAHRSNKFRRWLISSREPEKLSNINAVTEQNLSRRDEGARVCLVGEGTLGKAANTNDYIYADLVEMPSTGNEMKACFAWWVCGENQKARIGLSNPTPTNDVVEVLHRTWDTPPPSFQDHPTLSFLDHLPEQNSGKIFSMKELSLMYNYVGSIPGFYDVTLSSQSLPINVRDGGFKYDLNLLLNEDSLAATPFAGRTEQDCPLTEEEEIPAGEEANMPIGSWQVLHCWYNTWPDGSGRPGKNAFNSRLMGNVYDPWTTLSGDIVEDRTPKGDHITRFSTRARGTSSAGYARAPILTTFLGCFGLRVYQSRYKKGNTIAYQYSPVISWWNPYNVRMNVGAKKLWMYSNPYRTNSLQTWMDRIKRYDPDRPWGPKMFLHPAGTLGIPFQCAFHLDWGNYFVNSLEDQTSDIVFEPGEILVFTMGNNVESLNEVTSVGTPQEAPFVVGDHPDKMHHQQQDFEEYVNIDNPLADTNYNLYIDKFSAKLKFESKDTPTFSGKLPSDQYYGIYTDIRQGSWFVSMGEVLMSGGAYEEADHTHLIGREAFAVMYGYDGIFVESGDGWINLRTKGEVDRFSGAKGIAPAPFALGWYDYETTKGDDMQFLDAKWRADMFGAPPIYYVAIGIVPKSYNESLNEGFPMFKGKDYRTKIWQHSSPAFWGSALYKPDDQQRQYHPFQLAAIELGAGINRGPLDTLNGRNGVFGLFSSGIGGGENTSFISVLELPYHPPFSLAGFAGMRLTPGWYSEGQGGDSQAKSIASMRHAQYQAGVPGVGIGNSFADPCLPADDIYASHETNANKSSLLQNSKIFSDYYDHGLLINDALWDRWFCSSISDMPQGESGRIAARDTVTKFVKGEAPLPVSRYKLNLNGQTADQAIQRLISKDAWQHIARYLLIEGGFNINSTSEDAWTATLQGLAKRELLTNGGGRLSKIDKSDTEVLFSRFMVSTAKRPIDNLGYTPLEGSSSLRSSLKTATAWGEVRSLRPEQIRELARQIVKIVRERGPFLNMSDFINRRLDGGSKASLTGALQAAIDATDINDMFKEDAFNVNVQKEGTLFKYPEAAEGSMYTAAPGYLIQSDVLSSLGNILTVRDDTFTVRAYGCVRNARNTVLAQAWCEATVQRSIDYMDPTANNPQDSNREDYISQKIGGQQKLSEINRRMGRKLKVISFRWLDSWDI